MSGVGITYLWTSKEFPPFIRLEGKRGDYEIYVPERTCHNKWEIGFLCSECGVAVSGLNSIKYCPNCGAKVVEE